RYARGSYCSIWPRPDCSSCGSRPTLIGKPLAGSIGRFSCCVNWLVVLTLVGSLTAMLVYSEIGLLRGRGFDSA
ncbi:MAG: hypothetical protein WBG92_04960, partial [Thiohalocapsa sp.]